MQTIAQSPETIAKELLPLLHFSRTEVLLTSDAQRGRQRAAERAAILGNGYHGKVNIYFQTADGETKRVQTTVWACDDEFLLLKSGTSLPLRSVLGIDFI